MRGWARILVVAIGLAVGLVAGTTTAAAAVQPSEQDTAWMTAAHQANLAEIATGKMAQEKGTSATVKELGERFVTDHTKLDDSLKTLAGELNVTLPDQPNDEQKAVAEKLNAAAAGSEFDKMWIEQQLAAHAKSMKATQQELDMGEATQVKQAADAAMPVITAHHEALMKAAPTFGVNP
jgi:predicted outer membrane protein